METSPYFASGEVGDWLVRCRFVQVLGDDIDTLREQPPVEQSVTNEELIRFFSVLSHDLKSPIFAVDGFSELLVSDYLEKLDDEGQDFLKRIRSSAQYMKRVLDDMSHMVKLLARPTARRPTPMREIVEEVIQKHSFQIEEGGVQVDVPKDLPTMNVDAEKIREALSALLSNALFFSDKPKGERRISIEASTNHDKQRICIHDNGIGIDPRYVHQVFDLGGVSKLDRSRGGGPGYGLYLAKRVIETHGGELTVDSKLGEGSTFCFTVPV